MVQPERRRRDLVARSFEQAKRGQVGEHDIGRPVRQPKLTGDRHGLSGSARGQPREQVQFGHGHDEQIGSVNTVPKAIQDCRVGNHAIHPA